MHLENIYCIKKKKSLPGLQNNQCVPTLVLWLSDYIEHE